MRTILIDIEANGVNAWDEPPIHCIVAKDLESECTTLYTDHKEIGQSISTSGVQLLGLADFFSDVWDNPDCKLVAHNGIGYDFIVLNLLDGGDIYSMYERISDGRLVDSLILSRMIWPHITDLDSRNPNIPSHITGSHSLYAWGVRLGELKGDYDGPWDTPNVEMFDYCIQDIVVTEKLYDRIIKHSRYQNQEAFTLCEHKFGYLMRLQEKNGVCVDWDALDDLISKLSVRQAELYDELQVHFPPTYIEMKTAAYWITPDGTKYPTKSAACRDGWKVSDVTRGPNKFKEIQFKPTSREQFATRLMERYCIDNSEWPELTPSGKPKLDESILEMFTQPEAKTMLEFMQIEKHLGQIHNGDKAWIKYITPSNKIHGYINPLGTRTTRCSHSNPNLGQVPKEPEFRRVFGPREGWVLVGCDASGLEARILSEALYPYDQGAFGKVVLEGDIHSINAAKWEVERNAAKPPYYALLYGAGYEKLGKLLLPPTAPKKDKIALGKKIKNGFKEQWPQYEQICNDLDIVTKTKGWLTGLDGRLIHSPGSHTALNSLCQANGAILMKYALIIWFERLMRAGVKWGEEFALCLNVHDEVQFECKPELAEMLGRWFAESITEAGEHLGCKMEYKGEYMIGKNWSETH